VTSNEIVRLNDSEVVVAVNESVISSSLTIVGDSKAVDESVRSNKIFRLNDSEAVEAIDESSASSELPRLDDPKTAEAVDE
jgi:hypothetical protein